MAPKKGKEKDGDLEQKDVLQAVVLADSFASNFRPITFSMPKVLMPLANVPMIEYTLECLAAGGVQEVFIFCCAHANLVEEYVRSSDLVRRLATVSVHVLVSQAPCYSAGDALREVEARGVIKSDFVLVPGDVVANVSLGPLIAAHKKRRETDREAVITTVMKRLSPDHASRRADERMLVALSGETGRLLMYEDTHAHPEWQHKLRVPISLLQDTDCMQLHRDLYDTHIDICTPELLVLDNFDWQDLRRDLIPGVLGQFEYLGKTIYTHVLSSEYAARVHDPHTYDVVSRDIVQRWTYPLVPDANLLPGCSYRLGRFCVYKEDEVSLARSCELVRDCVVGGGTTVGNSSKLSGSVIGRGCTIGENVSINGSYLWANVTVEAGATLTGCICCDGVHVGRGVSVPKGCVIGPGVRLGVGASLQPFVRLRLPAAEKVDLDDDFGDDDDEDDDDDEEEAAESVRVESTLGDGGVGVVWKLSATASSMGFERAVESGPVEGELSEEEEEDDDDAAAGGEDEGGDFEAEVADTVRRGVESNHSVDNLALEVNGLKFAQNRTFADCLLCILPALLEPLPLAGKVKKERLGLVKKCLTQWGGLLKRFTQTASDQNELLHCLAETCAETSDLSDIFELLLNYLYERDDDLISEEAILQWADDAEEDEDGASKELLALPGTKNFIEWLRTAEEDDDDDDDDE